MTSSAPAALTRLAELDPHQSRAHLVKYAGLSIRTLRGYVDGPPGEALPCDRIGGKIVVKRSRHASSPVPAASAVIDRGQTSGRA